MRAQASGLIALESLIMKPPPRIVIGTEWDPALFHSKANTYPINSSIIFLSPPWVDPWSLIVQHQKGTPVQMLKHNTFDLCWPREAISSNKQLSYSFLLINPEWIYLRQNAACHAEIWTHRLFPNFPDTNFHCVSHELSKSRREERNGHRYLCLSIYKWLLIISDHQLVHKVLRR